jgi:hypothetical protein
VQTPPQSIPAGLLATWPLPTTVTETDPSAKAAAGEAAGRELGSSASAMTTASRARSQFWSAFI